MTGKQKTAISGDEIRTLVNLLKYIRADVAKVNEAAGIALDLAVTLLNDSARKRPPKV